eukprot:COSAG03_NODE_465_length_7686_cov_24.051008_10_plen_107_part_00
MYSLEQVSLEEGATTLGTLTAGDLIEALEFRYEHSAGEKQQQQQQQHEVQQQHEPTAVRFSAGWVRVRASDRARSVQLRRVPSPLPKPSNDVDSSAVGAASSVKEM